ncbi:MAG TPA: histidine kinase, partial [Anaerolineales bacterium]|nr:histidine kinase [Anaerolineales bacterium]
MSPDEKLGRRVIGAFLLGAFVALINFALDVSLIRLGITPHTYALNNLIIGAAAGLLAYIWMARQNARNELELSTQKLSEEILQKERKRIALELHDTVCQAQTGAIMHLECAGDSLGESPEARKQVFRALHLIRGSMTEMRCALWDLYPEELEKVHLKGAMESLVKDLTTVNGLTAHFSVGGMIRPLPLEVERGLLRISQEALSNVVKHAQPRE